MTSANHNVMLRGFGKVLTLLNRCRRLARCAGCWARIAWKTAERCFSANLARDVSSTIFINLWDSGVAHLTCSMLVFTVMPGGRIVFMKGLVWVPAKRANNSDPDTTFQLVSCVFVLPQPNCLVHHTNLQVHYCRCYTMTLFRHKTHTIFILSLFALRCWSLLVRWYRPLSYDFNEIVPSGLVCGEERHTPPVASPL